MAKLIRDPTVDGDWIVVCPERRLRHFRNVADAADDCVHHFDRERYATVRFRWMDETYRSFDETGDDACLAAFFPIAAFEDWKAEDIERFAVELWDKRVTELGG